MWDRLRQTVAPTAPFLDIDVLKTHLRVDYDDDDDYITQLISVAQAYIEGPKGCGFALSPQSWSMALDSLMTWSIDVPLGPVTSIDSITYLDLSNTLQTLDPSLYVVDLQSDPCSICRAYGQTWPPALPVLGSVKVNFSCGYTAIPYDLQHAGFLLIGNWYENRSAVVGIDSRDSPLELPLGVEAILSRYRSITFG